VLGLDLIASVGSDLTQGIIEKIIAVAFNLLRAFANDASIINDALPSHRVIFDALTGGRHGYRNLRETTSADLTGLPPHVSTISLVKSIVTILQKYFTITGEHYKWPSCGQREQIDSATEVFALVFKKQRGTRRGVLGRLPPEDLTLIYQTQEFHQVILLFAQYEKLQVYHSDDAIKARQPLSSSALRPMAMAAVEGQAPRESSPRTQRLAPACWTCGGTDHKAAACPSQPEQEIVAAGPASRPSTTVRFVKCQYCNEEGHVAKACDRLQTYKATVRAEAHRPSSEAAEAQRRTPCRDQYRTGGCHLRPRVQVRARDEPSPRQ
jgi:hypothetical protein